MSESGFGRWLQYQLDRRGWTQAEFARVGKFRTSTISNWVRGERIPDPASCDLIADVLGLDIDVVLAAAGHRPNIEDVDVNSVEAEMVGLVRRIHWTEERAATIRLVLRQWLEMDRKK